MLRKYQEAILNTSKQKNTLVILPTGLGKTLIGFYLIDFRLKYFGGKALFLAPTKPLVDQHFSNFKKLFSYPASILTGEIKKEKRKNIWENSKVIFATPQTIANDLRNGNIDFSSVSCIIFDEAHRCLKNYDYVYIAQRYKNEGKNIRILGLTASPGEEKTKIKEICNNLGIEAIEIRTRESPDVKPYLKKLIFKIVKVKLDKEFLILKERIESLYNKKINELISAGLIETKKPTKKQLLELQKFLQNQIKSKNYNVFNFLKTSAIVLKLHHAIELLETQSINALYFYLNDLYQKAKNKRSGATLQLIRDEDFEKIYLIVLEFYNKGKEHPKLEKLREILQEKIKNNPEFKAIVFTQYRDNIVKIRDYLNLFNIPCQIFIGQAKKRIKGLNQKQQKQILEEFKYGFFNVLISTSVGEEGLDLPEVDAVIFYEPIPSAIRKIQRAGRTGRTREGEVIILITEKTRDEGYYWSAFHKEKKMYDNIKNMKKFNVREKIKTLFDYLKK
ncbi:MAG: helicase-related protein [Candidatus Pacearchaeota archaeon]